MDPWIQSLYQLLRQRITQADPQRSYTARLYHAGLDRILQKIGEEAIEVILAAKGQGPQRVVEEVADLAYHVLVLLAALEIPPDQVLAELQQRNSKTRAETSEPRA